MFGRLSSSEDVLTCFSSSVNHLRGETRVYNTGVKRERGRRAARIGTTFGCVGTTIFGENGTNNADGKWKRIVMDKKWIHVAYFLVHVMEVLLR